MEQETVIKLSGVKKRYSVGENVLLALNGVDLEVQRGEFVCITGRSGSGKSTLLNVLAGLENPTEGEIVLLGEHIERAGESARIRFRRENIGFIFQSYNLMPQYTAVENVELPLALRGMAPKVRRALAMSVMEQVGVATHAKHKPSEMSGGQQQRVGIARALVTGPPLVLADELTGNLDTTTSDEIMALLTQMFRTAKTTLLLVSHDPEMHRYTDRTIQLLDGKVVRDREEEII